MSWLLPLDIAVIMGLLYAWPVVALGASFRLFNFPDLTLEGSLPVGGAVAAATLVHGVPPLPAIAASMAAGGVLGTATAVIHARLGVNKFLAGIIVVAMSYTIALRIMGSPNVGVTGQASVFDIVASLDRFAPNLQLGSILLLSVLLGVGVTVLLLMANSPWGLRVRLVGANPEHARALGLDATIYLMAGLALTNALTAGAGALIVMFQGFADVGMGQGVLILALASLTIGERLVPQRRLAIPAYVLLSAVAGSFAYQALAAYALRFGLAAEDLKLVTAVFVLGIVAIQLRRKDDNFLEAMG